jgi:hypothetical protein
MATIIISLVFCLSLFLSSVPGYTAVFNVASGDVAGLIAAIKAANANDEQNTINLAPGTYTLTAIDNSRSAGDANGLPVITGTITINGGDAETTIIERALPLGAFPRFRIFDVAAGATLTINQLSISGGVVDSFNSGGAGVLVKGTLTVNRSIIQNNVAISGSGGGISSGGFVTITQTSITNNAVIQGDGGGLANGGTMTIDDSTISDNGADSAGGISNGGTMTISNSTIALNFALSGAGIGNGGMLIVKNSTISGNTASETPLVQVPPEGGGIFNGGSGSVQMQNSILAQNTATDSHFGPGRGPDCFGSLTSLGNNIIGDLSDCSINLQSSDLIGDPGLGEFIDDGAPGHGRFNLLPSSPAINAGNGAACQATDQLDTPRLGACDVGAMEFYPVVNGLVAVGNVSTDFDATPVPGDPAGVFRITTDFTNRSNQGIVNPFVEVVELPGGNLLLNADGGGGGVGARLTLPDSATTGFQPGARSTFEFLIGLQQREPFTFFVNMLGDPGTSSPYVTMKWKSQPSSRKKGTTMVIR